MTSSGKERALDNAARCGESPFVKGEVCILAGGLSSRMGRDKSRIKVGGRTMLGRIRAIAKTTGWTVRVIRKDLVPRCGPLGGVLTALKTSRAERILFLACDMPCITPEFIARFTKRKRMPRFGLFAFEGERAGFPFLLRVSAFDLVERHIEAGEYSLQKLAMRGRAQFVRPKSGERDLLNVNTPEDLRSLSAVRVSPCRI